MELSNKEIKLDRMCYSKDKYPQLLCYLGIIFDVLYFVVIYKINDNYFYEYIMGISVVVNLLYLLMGFLSSEGVKNYKKEFGIVMIALGVIEIIRIFILPLKAHSYIPEGEAVAVMTDKEFVKCIIYLLLSAASMISGGILSELNSYKLTSYKERKAKGL